MTARRSARRLFQLVLGLLVLHAPALAQDTLSGSRSRRIRRRATHRAGGPGWGHPLPRSAASPPSRPSGVPPRSRAGSRRVAADRTFPAESLVVRDTPVWQRAGRRQTQALCSTGCRCPARGREPPGAGRGLPGTRRGSHREIPPRPREASPLAQRSQGIGSHPCPGLGALARRAGRCAWSARRWTSATGPGFGLSSSAQSRSCAPNSCGRACTGPSGWPLVLLALLAGYLYLDYVLLLFPWTRALGNSLASILLGPLATLGAGAIRFIPNLVFLVILALLTRYLLKLIRLFFRGVRDGTLTLSGFEADWATPTERIVRAHGHRLCAGHCLPAHTGLRIGGIQGHYAHPWPPLLSRIALGDRQYGGRAESRIPPGLQGGRSGEDRRARR